MTEFTISPQLRSLIEWVWPGIRNEPRVASCENPEQFIQALPSIATATSSGVTAALGGASPISSEQMHSIIDTVASMM